MSDNNKNPAMSDLERINRSYTTGSQSYTPSKNECKDEAKKPGDQQDSNRGSQYRPPLQG